MSLPEGEGRPATENLRDETVTIERLLDLAQGTTDLQKLKRILDEAERRRLETIDRDFKLGDIRTYPEYKEIVNSACAEIKALYQKADPNYREPSQPLKIVL